MTDVRLGAIVIVYAVVFGSAFSLLVDLAVHPQHRPPDLELRVGSAMAELLLLAGGVGLVAQKRWGRAVTCAGALLSGGSAVVNGLRQGVEMPGALAGLLLAVASWFVETAPAVSAGARRRQIDVAYACFAVSGLLITLPGLALTAAHRHTEPTVGMGLLTLALAALGAGAALVAVVLGIIHWRHWPLLALSALAIAVPMAGLVTGQLILRILLGAYVVASAGFGLHHFTRAQGRG